MSQVLLPGTTPLADMLDKPIMVVLRDGKKMFGTLRSYDQYANLLIHDAIERIFSGKMYGDIERGTFLIRGENVALFGTVEEESIVKDMMQEQHGMTQVDIEEVLYAQKMELEEQKRKDVMKEQAWSTHGLSFDFTEFERY